MVVSIVACCGCNWFVEKFWYVCTVCKIFCAVQEIVLWVVLAQLCWRRNALQCEQKVQRNVNIATTKKPHNIHYVVENTNIENILKIFCSYIIQLYFVCVNTFLEKCGKLLLFCRILSAIFLFLGDIVRQLVQKLVCLILSLYHIMYIMW